MTIDNKTGDEYLNFDIDSKASKVSALSWDKIDKCESLTCEEYYLPVKVE